MNTPGMEEGPVWRRSVRCLEAWGVVATLLLATATLSGAANDPFDDPDTRSRTGGVREGPAWPPSSSPDRPPNLRTSPRPKPIAFPPSPPPLGAIIAPAGRPPPRTNLTPGRPGGMADPAPAELQEHITEPFYAPLSTHLLSGHGVTQINGEEVGPHNIDQAMRLMNRVPLSDQQEEQLAAFVEMRASLLAELREMIARTRYDSPQQRLARLEAFSIEQTPRVRELERAAEELRASLARDAAWSEKREWRLERGPFKQPREKNAYLEYQVVRAAAYYQEGLSPAQRRALRELAMDMQEEIFAKPDAAVLTSDVYVNFQPETVRVWFPPEIPAEARARLDELVALKRELRQAIADVLYTRDRARDTIRSKELAALAEKQTPSWTRVDELAEEIRRRLTSTTPAFPRRAAPKPLPPELQAEIDAYLAAVKAEKERRSEEAMKRMLARMAEGKAANESTGNTVRRSTVTITGNSPTAAIGQELMERLRRIHAGIVAFAGEGAVMDLSVGSRFLDEFLRERELESAYWEYEFAALEPGLSPEQRRLLFAGAVATLRLPLPPEDRQATSAPGALLR